MTVYEFYNEISRLYPASLSSSWDNDGLMCCPDKNAPVKKVLVTLDATLEAIEYAKAGGFDTILTHHPLIFKGLKALNEDDVVGKRVLLAVTSHINVLSFHTRLDAGEGGVNDTLASLLELTDVVPFGDIEDPTLGRIGKTGVSNAESFAKLIKEKTGVPSVFSYCSRPITTVAVVGGGGGDFIRAAKACGADTLVTGECRYNSALDAAEDGMNIFVAGHYFTEMPVCQRLYSLAKEIAGAEAHIYTKVPELTF